MTVRTPIKLRVEPGAHDGRQDPEVIIDLDDPATLAYFSHSIGATTAVCVRVIRGGKRVSAFVSLKPGDRGNAIEFRFNVVNEQRDIIRDAVGHPWIDATFTTD